MSDRTDNINSLPELNLPECQLRIKRDKDVLKIWDFLRKKFIVLTPEEYVRQRFIHWLIESLDYPMTLMANEVGIELNGIRKRCDTVLFDTSGHPLGIIEYKAPGVTISQRVFDQIVRYNMVLKAPFLIVSNGLQHFMCRCNFREGSYSFLSSIPKYSLLKTIM